MDGFEDDRLKNKGEIAALPASPKGYAGINRSLAMTGM